MPVGVSSLAFKGDNSYIEFITESRYKQLIKLT